MRLSVRRQRFEPRERIACGDIERSKRQTLAQRATNVRSRNRIIFPRQTRYVSQGLHLRRSKEFFVYPDKLRVRLQGLLNSIQHPADAERFGGSGCVINSCLAVLGHANGPFSKITRIDELDWIAWLSWPPHISGTIPAPRPIRKDVALPPRRADHS